jgi:hypothetical protein
MRKQNRTAAGALRSGLALLLVPPLLAACQTNVLRNCIPAASPAVNVTIVDDATGAFLAASATAVAVDGSFQETLAPGDHAPSGELASRQGAFGRAGTYALTVTHAGYADWQGEATARRGSCGVETVAVRVGLVRGAGEL